MKRTRSNYKKRQNKNQPFFVDLPQDIVSKVLLHLPAKTLIRFKCVCKSWLNLISHPKFIKTHLQKSSSPTVHRLLVRELCYQSCFVKSLSTNNKKRDIFLLGIPTDDPFTSFTFLGSCNGLVCIAIRPIGVFLWNPSTKISKMMPCGSIGFLVDQVVNFGFGYDVVNDDYKLVVIDKQGLMRIFSGKSVSYRQLGYFPNEYSCGYRGEYVNGVLHWMLGNRSCVRPKVIATINLSNDEFGEIELPFLGDYSRLGVLDGCLSYLCHSVKPISNTQIFLDIWVMKEYGVRDSWTKLYTLINVNMDVYNRNFCYPLCITETGEIVLNCNERILIYNPTKHTFRRMSIGKSFSTYEAITYVESIVSPNIDDEVQILPSSNLPSSTSVFPHAEKEGIINKPKDDQENTGNGVVESGSTDTRWVERAYRMAVLTRGIKDPAISDIRESLELLRQHVPYADDSANVPDEEIENTLPLVRASGYDGLKPRIRPWP